MNEFDVWVKQYLPVAAALATVSRGLRQPPACVCGADVKHKLSCKAASRFWLSWLAWSHLPFSSATMFHFVPSVIFPLASPCDTVATGFSLVQTQPNLEDFADTLSEIKQKVLKNSNALLDVMDGKASMSSLRHLMESARIGAPQQEQRQCAVCDGPGSLACSRCRSMFYCSKVCQQRAWPQHKALCRTFARS